MTTLILGLVGAAVGSFFGPIGASIGWSLGVALGNMLDPQKIQGPKLTDLKLQGSSYGAVEPIIYGTVRLAGNVIWQTDLKPNEHTSGGGKKGGPKVTTYSYSASFDVAVCAIEVAEWHKIFAWGRLIYDGGVGDIPVTFYSGGTDQAPDPTEEADIGVGLTPAYRDISRAVFNNWDLTQFSNQIPGLEFVVSSKARPTGPILLVKDNNVTATPWDHRVVIGDWTTDLAADTPLSEPDPVTAAHALLYFEGSYGSIHFSKSNGLVMTDGSELEIWVSERVISSNPIDIVAMSAGIPDDGLGNYTATANFAYNVGVPAGVYVNGCCSTRDRRTLFILTGPSSWGDVNHWYKVRGDSLDDIAVVEDGTISPATSGAIFGYGNFVTADTWIAARPTGVSMVETNERWIWAYYAVHALGPPGPPSEGGSIVLYYIDDDGNMARDTVSGFGHPIPVGDIGGSLFTMTDGYCGTIGTQDANPAWSQTALWTRFAGQASVLLSEIVGNQCARAGLTSGQYDVTQLTDVVDGYIISQQMSGRAAIEALMPIFFFDAVESDGLIRFVKRGMGTIFTIDENDLAAHEDGSELPAQLSFVRKQEVDLPASISLVYPNRDADHQLGTQTAIRSATASESTSTIQTTVVLTDERAKQIADALLYNVWIERDTYTFYTTRKYIKYEPTDTAIVGGLRLRITTKAESESGVITWTAVPCYNPVFSQAGIGATSDGGGPQSPPTGPQRTDLVMLDIPLLATVTEQSVYRPAMAGHDRVSWMGGALMKSLDGGTSYSEIASSSVPDTIGTATTALPSFYGGNVVDEGSAVTVVIGNGTTLESVTFDGLVNGLNEAAIGREIIQYRDATLVGENTYVLTGLLRGRRGTDWAVASHSPGEWFVVLPTAIEVQALSADIGLPRIYKAVTLGSAISSAAAQEFTPRGVSVTPYSPVYPAAGTNGDGDWIFQWVRRARMNGGWLNFTDIPLDEASERYRLTLWSDDGHLVELTTFETTAPTYTLTVAEQTTLYGSPQSAEPFWTVAQLGSLGPGYDDFGRAPTIVSPPPAAPPPASVDVPLGDVQWHADYRFPNTIHCNKNFNWLQDTYSSSWAWAYMALNNDLRTALVIDIGEEGSRIINAECGMARAYAPVGFMIPYGTRMDPGPTLHSLYPLIDIPLPYPDDAL